MTNFLFPILTALIWRLRGWKIGNYIAIPMLYIPMYFIYSCMTGTIFHWWWFLAGIILGILEQNMNQDADEDDTLLGYSWSFFVGVCYGVLPLVALPGSNVLLWFCSSLGGGLGLLCWRLSQDYKWFDNWYKDDDFFEPNGWGELLTGFLLGLGMLIGKGVL